MWIDRITAASTFPYSPLPQNMSRDQVKFTAFGFGAGVLAAAGVYHLLKLIRKQERKSGIMFSYPNNPRTWKAMIVAQMTGQHCEEASEFTFGTDNKGDWFFKLHPAGQVPALMVEPQAGVFESNSIARYYARGTHLYGQNDLEASRIDGFLDLCVRLEDRLSTLWYYAMNAEWSREYSPEFLARQRMVGMKTLQAFEQQLEFGPYLVGESLSLADIVLYCVLHRAYEWEVFDAGELALTKRVQDHFARIGSLEEVRATVKDI